jgi:hypothetical protein
LLRDQTTFQLLTAYRTEGPTSLSASRRQRSPLANAWADTTRTGVGSPIPRPTAPRPQSDSRSHRLMSSARPHRGHSVPIYPSRQRSSASRPLEASTVGLTDTRTPVRTHARWLGAKRGASPSLISRVTAKRLNTVGGRKRRELSSKPSDAVSMSPSAAEMIPSPFWSTRATSAA